MDLRMYVDVGFERFRIVALFAVEIGHFNEHFRLGDRAPVVVRVHGVHLDFHALAVLQSGELQIIGVV